MGLGDPPPLPKPGAILTVEVETATGERFTARPGDRVLNWYGEPVTIVRFASIHDGGAVAFVRYDDGLTAYHVIALLRPAALEAQQPQTPEVNHG